MELVAVLGILLGAISPGPSFVLVVRTAVATSRWDGLSTALGMGVGGLIFASTALLGLHVVLSNVPVAYQGLRIAGGVYLLFLAFQLWRSAPSRITVESSGAKRSLHKSFIRGLATQLSNPKTAIVYASIFTALLPADQSYSVAAILLPAIFLIESSWDALVTTVLSSELPRRNYLRAKIWLDRIAAGVICVLGAKLIWEAR